MMKLARAPSFSLATLTRRDRWRLGLLAIIAVGFALALLLHERRETREVAARDSAMRGAWQQRGSAGAAGIDAGAVLARYAIRQPGGSSELNWKVASAAELRTSLLALDAAGVRLTGVKITRDGAGFTVSAERAS